MKSQKPPVEQFSAGGFSRLNSRRVMHRVLLPTGFVCFFAALVCLLLAATGQPQLVLAAIASAINGVLLLTIYDLVERVVELRQRLETMRQSQLDNTLLLREIAYEIAELKRP